MLAVGLIFIVAGALLAAFVHRPIGIACAVIGFVLVLLALVDFNHAEAGLLALPLLGTLGTPPPEHLHGAGETEAALPITDPGANPQPVWVAFLIGAIPLVAAAVTALGDVFVGIPEWIVPTLAIIGTLTTGLAALWARSKVTPLARPMNDLGEPLVPVGAGIDGPDEQLDVPIDDPSHPPINPSTPITDPCGLGR